MEVSNPGDQWLSDVSVPFVKGRIFKILLFALTRCWSQHWVSWPHTLVPHRKAFFKSTYSIYNLNIYFLTDWITIFFFLSVFLYLIYDRWTQALSSFDKNCFLTNGLVHFILPLLLSFPCLSSTVAYTNTNFSLQACRALTRKNMSLSASKSSKKINVLLITEDHSTKKEKY